MVLWRLLKTAIFTILAPGTVALYLPQMLRDRSADLAGRFVYTDPWMALFLCGAAIYLWCAWDFVVKGLGTPAPIGNISRSCPGCGHVAAENRKTQARFACVACGFRAPADLVAAWNIKEAGLASLACSRPSGEVSPSCQEPTEGIAA